MVQIFGQLYLSFPDFPIESEDVKRIPVLGEEPDSKEDVIAWRADSLSIVPDWAVVSYGEQDKKAGIFNPVVTKLESGDVVGMFNRIAKGDVLWEGTIDMEPLSVCTGVQKGIKRSLWLSMFVRKMPAVLERDGRKFHGVLEPFHEQGMEGHIALEFMEFGYSGYGALRGVRNGDHLTVYKCVTQGNEDWHGRLSFSGGDKPLIYDGASYVRDVKHMPIGNWVQLTHEKRPVVLTRNPR